MGCESRWLLCTKSVFYYKYGGYVVKRPYLQPQLLGGYHPYKVIQNGLCLFWRDEQVEVSARCIRGEMRIAFLGNYNTSGWRDVKELLWIYGIQNGCEVPCGTILYLRQIGFVRIDDGMVTGPGKVVFDAFCGITDL